MKPKNRAMTLYELKDYIKTHASTWADFPLIEKHLLDDNETLADYLLSQLIALSNAILKIQEKNED